jgi:hypothetical protein
VELRFIKLFIRLISTLRVSIEFTLSLAALSEDLFALWVIDAGECFPLESVVANTMLLQEDDRRFMIIPSIY